MRINLKSICRRDVVLLLPWQLLTFFVCRLVVKWMALTAVAAGWGRPTHRLQWLQWLPLDYKICSRWRWEYSFSAYLSFPQTILILNSYIYMQRDSWSLICDFSTRLFKKTYANAVTQFKPRPHFFFFFYSVAHLEQRGATGRSQATYGPCPRSHTNFTKCINNEAFYHIYCITLSVDLGFLNLCCSISKKFHVLNPF